MAGEALFPKIRRWWRFINIAIAHRRWNGKPRNGRVYHQPAIRPQVSRFRGGTRCPSIHFRQRETARAMSSDYDVTVRASVHRQDSMDPLVELVSDLRQINRWGTRMYPNQTGLALLIKLVRIRIPIGKSQHSKQPPAIYISFHPLGANITNLTG